MSPFVSFLLLLSSMALLTMANGEGRAPHGIAYENPVAFSPAAYEFFHPENQGPDTKNPCAASNCSRFPIAAQMDGTKAPDQSKTSTQKESEHGLGAGGIAVLVFGMAFAVLLAMGAYYVLNIRLANAKKGNYVQSAV